MLLTIVGIASKYIHQSLAPWCLKAGLEQYGVHVDCRVLELNINQPISKALEALMETKPGIAAFSCYIWNIGMVRSLAADLKILSPDTVIVLGGPEAGSRPENILREIPQADYVITGPGEYAFAELIRHLIMEKDPVTIPGLSLRRGGNIISVPPKPLPFPIQSPYGFKCLQSLNGRIAYVETSRGCPFACTFCLSGGDEKVTFLPMDEAKERLLFMAASGAKTVKLVDRTFNCQKDRANELFQFLIEKHKQGAFQDVCFHFEVAADLFGRETLELLQSAPPGLFQMEAGLQSFHSETLEACHRKTDLDQLCKNVSAILEKQNIHLHLDLIAGLPYEDFDTFSESVNRAVALKPHMLQLGFLKLLHGSSLRAHAEDFKIVFHQDPPYEILKNAWLSFEELCLLKKCEDGLDKLYNSGRFRRTLDYIFSLGIVSPFQLFLTMGKMFSAQEGSLSLNQVSDIAFAYLCSMPGVSSAALRDFMAYDRLSTEGTGVFPQCLKVPDKRLGAALSKLKRDMPPGESVNACILYNGCERLLAAYPNMRHPVTGEFETKELPLETI